MREKSKSNDPIFGGGRKIVIFLSPLLKYQYFGRYLFVPLSVVMQYCSGFERYKKTGFKPVYLILL